MDTAPARAGDAFATGPDQTLNANKLFVAARWREDRWGADDDGCTCWPLCGLALQAQLSRDSIALLRLVILLIRRTWVTSKREARRSQGPGFCAKTNCYQHRYSITIEQLPNRPDEGKKNSVKDFCARKCTVHPASNGQFEFRKA